MSLKSVKSKIKSIDKTRQVTKAMEAVSAVKMRKSQAQALGARSYAIGALSILKAIAGTIESSTHPLLVKRPTKRKLLIVVSADKGLAGSYGSTLIKALIKLVRERDFKTANTDIITVGRKANEFFTKRGYTIKMHHERWSDQIDFAQVAPLAELVSSLYNQRIVDEVTIMYTNFISTLNQEVYVRQLLPVTFSGVEEVIRGIVPKEGKFKELNNNQPATTANQEYIFEPSNEVILEELIPELFKIQIYHSVLEANASEHSSRMIAMKNASDNAKEISRGLKLKFNKVRQAAITKEVSEIVSGMESMKIID